MPLNSVYVKMIAIVTMTGLLVLSTQFRYSYSKISTEKMELNFDSDEAIFIVSKFSPSVAVGIKLLSSNLTRYLRDRKLITLVKALGPSYIRVGGTTSDHARFISDGLDHFVQKKVKTDCDGQIQVTQSFEQHIPNIERLTSEMYDNGFSQQDYPPNISYTAFEFDNFMEFVSCTHLKVIFGLNLLDRNGATWSPDNTMKLLDYAKSKAYRIDWELGNEPNSFNHSAGIKLSPKEVADGFLKLKSILNGDKWWRESMLYGPDANNMFKSKCRRFLQNFLHYVGNVVNSVTFHQYYINSVNATVTNFTDYKILNKLNSLIDDVVNVIRKENRWAPIWLGETSSSYGGGADGLSNTYVAGFMWLDKLGISASKGINLVVRQTLISGHYALINKEFDPNPDYWLTLLYKTLVGTKVLNTTVTSKRNATKYRDSGKFRVYAHCTNTERTVYNNGAVTIYYLNLLSRKRALTIATAPGRLSPKIAMTYILTPAQRNLTSKEVYLNGKHLQMVDINTMPPLEAAKIDLQKNQIILPEKSFGFVVLPDVEAPACL